MKISCEMYIEDFFKLSSGHIAIVGSVIPNIKNFMPNNSMADLYVAGEKIKTIDIIGEDRFSGGDKSKRQNKRAVRTDSDITEDLILGANAKLVIYSK